MRPLTSGHVESIGQQIRSRHPDPVNDAFTTSFQQRKVLSALQNRRKRINTKLSFAQCIFKISSALFLIPSDKLLRFEDTSSPNFFQNKFKVLRKKNREKDKLLCSLKRVFRFHSTITQKAKKKCWCTNKVTHELIFSSAQCLDLRWDWEDEEEEEKTLSQEKKKSNWDFSTLILRGRLQNPFISFLDLKGSKMWFFKTLTRLSGRLRSEDGK